MNAKKPTPPQTELLREGQDPRPTPPPPIGLVGKVKPTIDILDKAASPSILREVTAVFFAIVLVGSAAIWLTVLPALGLLYLAGMLK